MKKQLSENSFRSIGEMSSEELTQYLREYGEFYFGANGNWRWVRTKPHKKEEDKKLPKFGFIDPEWFKSLKLDLNEEDEHGTVNNSLSVEAYNILASCDEWEGGYVEGLGYVDVAASSLYGNSLYLSGSWYDCGSPQNPVRIAKFYKLSLENKWRGGNVSSWGYVSESTKLLGCSTETLTKASVSEVTLGTLVNVGTSLGHHDRIETLRAEFEESWDKERESYQIDDKTLSEYIRKNFYYAQTNDMKEGLRQHKTILLRKVTRTTNDYMGVRKFGNDVMVVDYNGVKQKYECIEPVGPSVTSISENDIQNGKIEIQTHVLSRS